MFDQTQNNNPYFNNGMMMQPGNYQFNGQQMPKIQNVLSPDEIKALQQQKDKFNLGLTEKESLQGACNHRTADGMGDALAIDPVTGLVHCSICGYQFKPIDENTSYDDIKARVSVLVDSSMNKGQAMKIAMGALRSMADGKLIAKAVSEVLAGV